MRFLGKVALVAALGGIATAAPDQPPMPASESLSAADLVARVKDVIDRAKGDLQRTPHLQAIARKEKDVIKLTCVNDKLVQMLPLMNIIGRDAAEGARTAASVSSLAESGAEVRKLREGAEACIGQPLLVTDSSNDYTHPDINDNPGDNPYGDTIEPPAYASPFN